MSGQVASRLSRLDDPRGSNRTRRPEFDYGSDEPLAGSVFGQMTEEEADYYTVGPDGYCAPIMDAAELDDGDCWQKAGMNTVYRDMLADDDYDSDDECTWQDAMDASVRDDLFEDHRGLRDEANYFYGPLFDCRHGFSVGDRCRKCETDDCYEVLAEQQDAAREAMYSGYGLVAFASEFEWDCYAVAANQFAEDQERLDALRPARRTSSPVADFAFEAGPIRSSRTARQRRDRRSVNGRLRLRTDHATGVDYAPRWMYMGLRDTWTDENRLRGPRRQKAAIIRFERELDLESALEGDLSHFADPWNDEWSDEPLGNQMVRRLGIYPVTSNGSHPDWDSEMEEQGDTDVDTWGIPPEDVILLREELRNRRPGSPFVPSFTVDSRVASRRLDCAHRVGRR